MAGSAGAVIVVGENRKYDCSRGENNGEDRRAGESREGAECDGRCMEAEMGERDEDDASETNVENVRRRSAGRLWRARDCGRSGRLDDGTGFGEGRRLASRGVLRREGPADADEGVYAGSLSGYIDGARGLMNRCKHAYTHPK